MRKIYFGALSDEAIDVVGQRIASRLKLDAVSSDAEDTWEYAIYKGDRCALNISKTEGLQTIRTWMKTAPDGINYQLILSLEDGSAILDEFEMVARDALGHSLIRYEGS